MDHAAALALARAVRERVGSGETSPLWSEFTPRMRAAFQDSAAFARMGRNIHAQLGSIDSVLSEEVADEDTVTVVRSRLRVGGLPAPVLLAVAFDASGRIDMLRVRPEGGEPREYPSPYLDYATRARLTLPFDGEWYVVWGGRTLAENYHAATRSQRFAYDILVRKDGSSHAGDGKALGDYYCYGRTVLAPGDGVVVTAVDSLPDNAIGRTDPAHPAGNHVVIDHGGGEYSLLAHMQQYSLRVKAGDRVRAGRPVGRVGNSGNTSEPHVHVHLMNRPGMADADGLPMPFAHYVADGRPVARGEPVRGQTIHRARR